MYIQNVIPNLAANNKKTNPTVDQLWQSLIRLWSHVQACHAFWCNNSPDCQSCT